jgi:hypothetical protein
VSFLKKGQAAMEFLMTYGWAILVVLAAIGALAYFGVLSPSKHIPESCIFKQGIACLDFKVTADTVDIYFQNGYAQDIDVYNVTIGSCDTADIGERMTDLDAKLVTLTNCDNGIAGDKFKEDVYITFSFAGSDLVKRNKGEVISMITE